MFDLHASLGFPPIKFYQPELIVWKEIEQSCDDGKWGRVDEKMSNCCVSLGNSSLLLQPS